MSQKAWMNAYTKGSKSLQDRLARVHAKNPEFQDFVKKHGLGSNLSVKQSGQQKKTTSIGSVKPVTDANPERGKLDRLAVIKAAAEKQRNRRLANSNRVAFGGELGGGFQMPGSGFRRYSESLEEESVYMKVHDPHKTTGMPSGWNKVHTIKKDGDKHYVELKDKGYGVMFHADGNKHQLRRGHKHGQPITVHTAHDIVNGQNEAWDESNYKWAEQSPEWKEKVKKDAAQRKSLPPKKSSFASGMKRAAEQLRKDRARKTDEEVNYGDASYTMRRGGWVVKRNGKVASVILPTEKHAQDFINSTKMTLGRKVANVVRNKAKDIARGMGRISYATESAANRRRILSYDSAILPVEHEHPLTTPHPKAKLDALRAAGKHEEARELERKWLRKAMSKNKNSENSNEQ